MIIYLKERNYLVPLCLRGKKDVTAIFNEMRSNMEFSLLTKREEHAAKIIVNAAYAVHKELGPGLLERVYEVCLAHVIRKSGLLVQ